MGQRGASSSAQQQQESLLQPLDTQHVCSVLTGEQEGGAAVTDGGAAVMVWGMQSHAAATCCSCELQSRWHLAVQVETCPEVLSCLCVLTLSAEGLFWPSLVHEHLFLSYYLVF